MSVRSSAPLQLIDSSHPPASRGPSESVASPEVSLLDLVQILRRRWSTFVFGLAAVILGVSLWTFSQTSLYRATTTLIVEPETTSYGGLSGATALSVGLDFFETQQEILRSSSVLAQVVEKENLAQDSDFVGHASPVNKLRDRIQIEPVRYSRVIRVHVDHSSPEKAVAIGDALTAAFLERTIEDRRAASLNAFRWLSGQIDTLRKKVEDAEWALLDYKGQGETDIVSIERRRDLVEERLASLNTEYNEAVAESAELQTLLGEIQRVRQDPALVESLPRDLNNPVVQQLRQELGELSVELAKLSSKFRPKHPEIQGLQSQIDQVKARLREEAQKIYQSVEIEWRIAKATEETAREQLDAAKRESMEVAEQSIDYEVLRREAESNRQIFDVMLQRLREVDIGGDFAAQTARVLDPARASLGPVSPRKRLNLLLGLALGTLVGVSLCLLHDQIDNRFDSERDVEQYLGLKTLGLIPRQKAALRWETMGEEVRLAYSSLGTTLRLYGRNHLLRSLVITSALRSEGKTVTSASLGVAFAQAGVSTLLIDADMFQAGLGRYFKVRQDQGLADYFLKNTPPEELIRPTVVKGLDLLPAGLIPPNPGALLGSSHLQALLEELQGRYQIVIVDSPPVSATLDVGFLGSSADAVLMAVRANETTHGQARRVLQQLQGAGCNVLGVVLTVGKLPADAPDGTYYHYRRDRET